MSNIAIITARGGSKRIPRKNIKDFCGKPIIAYSIEAALKSRIFDEVMVSTEDEEIAEIAKKYGAAVPFYRSEATANDFADTADVLEEVIKNYEKQGSVFDIICCLYPTAPFVTAEKLQFALETMFRQGADALVPVVKFSYPPQWGFVIDAGKLTYKWEEHLVARSQDLESLYHDVGQFYFMKRETFLKTKTLVSNNTVPYILSEMEMQDIDHIDDWCIAEIKYKMLNKL